MTKAELKKALGLSDENFDFYVDMGMIKKAGRNNYTYTKVMDDMFLEKGTVFKYSFDDSYIEDMREFKKIVKHTGKVKQYTPEEIEEYKRKRGLK